MTTIKTTNVNAPGSWAPDSVSAFKFEDVLPENLYLSLTTFGGSIVGDQPSLRVPYVSDADDAGWVPEGDVIPETDVDLDEVLIQTRKVGQIITLSNEQAMQQDSPTIVANSMKRNVTAKLNRALLVEAAPVAPAVAPAAGIINTPGIITGDDLVDDLDPLIELISEVEANLGSPRYLVVDPLAKAHLYKLKAATDSNQGLLTAATAEPTSPILGLQVIVSPFLTAYTGLLVDSTAIVSAYSEVQVAHSTDAKFTADSTVYRVTCRVGHAVVKPNRIAKLAIGEA